jgi:hypothetical protein
VPWLAALQGWLVAGFRYDHVERFMGLSPYLAAAYWRSGEPLTALARGTFPPPLPPGAALDASWPG